MKRRKTSHWTGSCRRHARSRRRAAGGTCYYKLPEGVKLGNVSGNKGGGDKPPGPWGYGIDGRSSGGYVLIPPSVVGGKPYTVVKDRPIAPCPPELIARAGRQRDKEATATGVQAPEGGWDKPIDLGAAREWLLKQPQAQEGERDNTAYKLAAGLRDRGIGQTTALGWLVEWNRRNPVPLGRSEIAGRVRSVYSSGNVQNATAGTDSVTARRAAFDGIDPSGLNEFGPVVHTSTVASRAEPDDLPPDDDGAAAFSLIPPPWSDGQKPTVPPPWPDGLFDGPAYAARPVAKWIITDVLAEASLSAASGRSRAGKSFNELALALSAATGKPWLGMPVEITGPVLYVAAEGQERIWKDVCAWCAKFDVDPATLRGRFYIFDRAARLNTADGRRALGDTLATIRYATGRLPIAVWFDTLRRNMRGGVSEEGPTSEVLHAANELQRGGIAVTLVAHLGRGHTETKGLTDWEDDADQVRTYTGTVAASDTEITFSKVKSAKDGWSIAVEYADHKFPDDDHEFPGQTTKVAFRGARRDEVIDVTTGKPAGKMAREFERKKIVLCTLAALRSMPGKTWAAGDLAREMRDHYGCTENYQTLRTGVLAKGKKGWAKYDPILASYVSHGTQDWVAPRYSDLPPLPDGVVLPERQEDAP